MDFLKDKNITSKDETNYRYVLSQQKNSLYIPVLAVNITYYSVMSCISALTTLGNVKQYFRILILHRQYALPNLYQQNHHIHVTLHSSSSFS